VNVSTAIRELRDTSAWTALSEEQVLRRINAIAEEFAGKETFELAFALGSALEYYVALAVRGDARKPLLDRVVGHFERAHAQARGQRWTEYSFKDEPELAAAAALGSLLVRQALVRDLDRGILLLQWAWDRTASYEPYLCQLADGLYMRGEYAEAARIAIALHQRAADDPEWRSSVPPHPMQTAAKAYRAEARRLKKAGQVKEAVDVLERLASMGCASFSDDRMRRELLRSTSER